MPGGATCGQRLRARNRAFAVVSALALAVLLLVTRWPLAAGWFGFEPPPLAPWLLAVCLPLAVAALLKAGRREPAAPDAGVPATAG